MYHSHNNPALRRLDYHLNTETRRSGGGLRHLALPRPHGTPRQARRGSREAETRAKLQHSGAGGAEYPL